MRAPIVAVDAQHRRPPKNDRLMAGPGPQPIERRQAWYGSSYVQEMCIQAGYAWTPTPGEADVHSFDGDVTVHPGVKLHVQVKCRRKPILRSASYAIEPAWRENWADLHLPAFFVVVVVPETVVAWVQHEEVPAVRTVHNTSAYWTRIGAMEDRKRIGVSAKQRLTADTIELWRSMYYEQVRLMYGGTAR